PPLLEQVLEQLDPPPAGEARAARAGHRGIRFRVEAEQVSEDLAPHDAVDELEVVAIAVAKTDDDMAVDLPRAEDLAREVDHLPVLLPVETAVHAAAAAALERALGDGVEAA